MFFDALFFHHKPMLPLQPLYFDDSKSYDDLQINQIARKKSLICLKTKKSLQIVADKLHAEDPSTRFGYYGIFPKTHQLACSVDVLFPTLYCPNNWFKNAKRQINRARKYQKQIFPILFPDAQDYDDWWDMLNLCCEFTDGAVLFGGHGKEWNSNAEWWEATRDFLMQR